MNDFILQEREDGNLVLELHPNIRVPRIILPFIAGCIAVAVNVFIMPAAIDSLHHMAGGVSVAAAVFNMLVCFCFVVVAIASFGQAGISAFGKQLWYAEPDCLEFHQELFGWRIAKRLTGQVIVLSPPTTPGSTSWKLVAAANASAEHVWSQKQIHISSDDDELRNVGQLIARSTGWNFVEAKPV